MRGRAAHLGGFLVGMAILFGWSGSSMAAPQKTETCPVCGKASEESGNYSSHAGYTLVRGAANTTMGWTELIRQPVDEVRRGGNILTGLAKGVGCGVTRTLQGGGEVLTFWVPKSKSGYLHIANTCPICMGKK